MAKRLLMSLCLLFAAMAAQGQKGVPTLEGTDFWLSFLRNGSSQRPACSLIIASEYACTAQVSNTRTGWDTVVVIDTGIYRLDLPDNPATPPLGVSVTDGGWHVTTSAPAVVYASNFALFSQDITSVMPTPTLRRDYMTQTYGKTQGGQEVYVVAPYDSTLLHIYFAENAGGTTSSHYYFAGDSCSVMLMQGQVCRLYTTLTGDNAGFSGTRFHSTKPVAVFQGHSATNVPDGQVYQAIDHLYEQCIPSEYLGRHFLVVPTTGRVPYYAGEDRVGSRIGDMVKVTALEDGCVVTVEGRRVTTLSSGESYTFFVGNQPPDILPPLTIPDGLDFYQSDALSVITSSPVQMCLYITSLYFGGSPGDPAVVVVPPLEWSVSRSVTAVHNSNYLSTHCINIVALTSDVPQITLDGQSIASAFSSAPRGYSYARLVIPEGEHVLDAGTGRFLATFYGLGDAESYAFVSGMALHKIDYGVHVDSYVHCQGDTLTAIANRNDTLSVEWYLDGRHLASGVDTLRIPLDSAGTYFLSAVFMPLGVVMQEPVIVNPVYSFHETDSICPGDTVYWHGMAFTDGGSYPDSLVTDAGCDSVFTLRLVARSSAADLSIAVIPDCPHGAYIIRSHTAENPDSLVAQWVAVPHDATLASQPWNRLVVHPTDTTLYSLHINGCRAFDTAFSLPPLVPVEARMEVDRERLDESHPSFTARDCSLHSDGRNWWVDGAWVGDSPEIRYTANLSADKLRLTLAAYNETCADTLTRDILIEAFSVWLPNVFAPGKEDNALFAPVFKGAYAEDLVIYDRQGMVVVRLEGPAPAWDGTKNGTPCQQGAYAWELRYRITNNPAQLWKKQGLVTLLR